MATRYASLKCFHLFMFLGLDDLWVLVKFYPCKSCLSFFCCICFHFDAWDLHLLFDLLTWDPLSTTLDKTFRQKLKSQAKLDKTRKIWYLLLHNFGPLMHIIIYFCLGTECPKSFEIFLIYPNFLKFIGISTRIVRQFEGQLLQKVYFTRYQVLFCLWQIKPALKMLCKPNHWFLMKYNTRLKWVKVFLTS